MIGVNWAVIAPEVDATISAYAHARDMAITQAQRKMIENMPAAKKKGTKKEEDASTSSQTWQALFQEK